MPKSAVTIAVADELVGLVREIYRRLILPPSSMSDSDGEGDAVEAAPLLQPPRGAQLRNRQQENQDVAMALANRAAAVAAADTARPSRRGKSGIPPSAPGAGLDWDDEAGDGDDVADPAIVPPSDPVAPLRAQAAAAAEEAPAAAASAAMAEASAPGPGPGAAARGTAGRASMPYPASTAAALNLTSSSGFVGVRPVGGGAAASRQPVSVGPGSGPATSGAATPLLSLVGRPGVGERQRAPTAAAAAAATANTDAQLMALLGRLVDRPPASIVIQLPPGFVAAPPAAANVAAAPLSAAAAGAPGAAGHDAPAQSQPGAAGPNSRAAQQ